MTLRHLVPALGLAALTATTAFAAEKAPTVTFAGWSDNILTINAPDNDLAVGNPTGTAKDELGTSVRFSSAASLKAMWNVADKVDAKVNLWFYPDTVSSTNSNFQAREMFVNVALSNGFSWQMGKYINHIGWIAADPTGLYTVNNSLIGYLGIYGNDVIGTALVYDDAAKSPVSAQLHVTNGYFSTPDAISPGYVATSSTRRENSDLGIGFGATYALPDEMGNIDFDLAYDMHSELNGAATSLGGDAFLIGLNATIKPTANLMIGAEVMSIMVDDSEAFNGASGNDGFKRLQGMVLANIRLPNAPANMSITGMIQYIEIEPDTLPAGSDKESRLEAAVTVLTNPFDSTNFGLNFELAYYVNEGVGFRSVPTATLPSETSGVNFAIEALATF